MSIPTGASTRHETLDPRARLLTSQLMMAAKQEMVVEFAGGERKLKL